ncbi:2,3-bisphosphoglycerate-independent phosphoglycerate mutase [bacterium]|nr:2,3-bisphosphoglycerate-independent phosphoglycerate mutase [bacterium]
MNNTPLLLMILDGYALNPNQRGNAVAAARRPTLSQLEKTAPTTTLITCGERVGLPEGQMGNSEVGHLNLGAGRVVEQELTKINRLTRTKAFSAIPEFKSLIEHCKKNPGAALHFIGLTSSGGVHSSLDHLLAMLSAAAEFGLSQLYIHAITDGRDKPPQSAGEDFQKLETHLQQLKDQYPTLDVRIVSVIGRYFAMDRDKRWERTEKSYRLSVTGQGEKIASASAALQRAYASQQTDEFIEPFAIVDAQGTVTTVNPQDAVIFWNFRTDRMRQLVAAYYDPGFSGFERDFCIPSAQLRTLTVYDEHFPIEALVKPLSIKNHLGEVLAQNNLRQLRLAETEKYPHVTYFFNGGIEEPYRGESRVLVQSPRDVATYDLKPEMSAYEVTDKLVTAIQNRTFDVGIINYANCDMVGHTGNLAAAIKAVETVDSCLAKVLTALEQVSGNAIITADHGNADQMIDYETGEPHTFHTLYPVPVYLTGPVAKTFKLRAGGSLCDIAPTMLALLGIPQPDEMTGKSLIE